MSTYRCHACAGTFTAWAPAERHADAEHHHRVEVILADEKEPPMSPKKSIQKDRRDGERRMGLPKPNLPSGPPADQGNAGKGGRRK